MKGQAEISSLGWNGNMKKFFSRDNFVLSTFDQKQKRQSLFVSLLILVMGVVCAFTFMNMLYCFSDIVGSCVCASFDIALRDFGRSLPIFLSFFMSIWTIWSLHTTFRNENNDKFVKGIFRKGIVIAAFGGFNIVYILVMLIAGRFTSLVEGSPSYLYPLDAMLFSLVFLAIGVFFVLYTKKFQEKLPYVVPTRGPAVQKARFLHHFFVTIWMLVAFFAFAAFAYGLFIIDFLHGYQFFSIALLIAYFLSPLYLLVWEFYYNELTEEKKKEFLLPLALAGLILAVVVMAIYFVALGLNLDGPSNVGFGVLPVAYAASVNIATMLVVATPTIVCVVALIKALIGRKKAK